MTTKISLRMDAVTLNTSKTINGFKVIGQTDEGVQVIDCRPLREKLYFPVKHRGVKRYLGADAYVITENYYSELTK